jgi:hypothetical protein
VHLAFVASMIGLAVLSGGRAEALVTVAPAAAFREVPAGSVRQRSAANRPPGRDDRHTAPRMAPVHRPLTVLACRVQPV